MVDPRVDPDEMIEKRASRHDLTPSELIEQIKALAAHAGIPIVVIVDKPAGQLEYAWTMQGIGAALDKVTAVRTELKKMLTVDA